MQDLPGPNDVCLVAVPTGSSDLFRPCDSKAVTFVRVPYLLGGSTYVPLCSYHRAEHNRFHADTRVANRRAVAAR